MSASHQRAADDHDRGVGGVGQPGNFQNPTIPSYATGSQFDLRLTHDRDFQDFGSRNAQDQKSMLFSGPQEVIKTTMGDMRQRLMEKTLTTLVKRVAALEAGSAGAKIVPAKARIASLKEAAESGAISMASDKLASLVQAAQGALPRVTEVVFGKLKRAVMTISSAMDPRLQVACARRRMGKPSRAMASTTAEEVAVIARVTDVEAWEELSEVRVGSTLGASSEEGTLVTGRIPVSRIEEVRAQPFVRSLKASQALRRTLAETAVEMGTRTVDYPAQTAPDGGAGVVVGIVDYGCDFAHQNFRNANGSTRLLGIWDQYGVKKRGVHLATGGFTRPGRSTRR
ncbi:MAG: hypothetical protein IPK22_09620 [Verrucomicrobiaceae bacterium]|nr:hypothetical protein [Verrucomicrobiaceae bacterium]